VPERNFRQSCFLTSLFAAASSKKLIVEECLCIRFGVYYEGPYRDSSLWQSWQRVEADIAKKKALDKMKSQKSSTSSETKRPHRGRSRSTVDPNDPSPPNNSTNSSDESKKQ
jgi:hypothetical protein